eukprot:TRINITY_DN1604_c0_g1_i7.p3 TRINITY_DN1604_c0_g1~~TRINITY_DN1604_c0_g1_i7.p3  ORF type:complete len:131 (-),score=4.56 TRINITY_DN1604_c0_g1_i7:773-1165(-)
MICAFVLLISFFSVSPPRPISPPIDWLGTMKSKVTWSGAMACVFLYYRLHKPRTSLTMFSISFFAASYRSAGPSTNTFLTPVLCISFFATCIFAPLSCCNCLIVSPPFPIISPTHSFGTGIMYALLLGGP